MKFNGKYFLYKKRMEVDTKSSLEWQRIGMTALQNNWHIMSNKEQVKIFYMSPKTFRKWVWLILEAIAGISPKIVSTAISDAGVYFYSFSRFI